MVKKVVNEVFRRFFIRRYKRMEEAFQQPEAMQRDLLERLIQSAVDTEFGQQHDFHLLRSPEDYAKAVPLRDYEQHKPYIERMMQGEANILWPGMVRWFSKSSGTTSDKSKYIPVSDENLRQCHTRGNWDMITTLYHEFPDARIFEGKSLLLGGSLQHIDTFPKIHYGDVSAIMILNMPYVARPFFTPDVETALMDDFEEKLSRMTDILIEEGEELALLGGVPTWTVVLFKRVLELTGKQNVLEVWPNLQAYFHGGVSFEPYREQFAQYIPDPNFYYQEAYNASEGYFGIQRERYSRDLFLLVNNGVYYEFVPMDDFHADEPQVFPLWEVEPGVNYAMYISTNAGLWRYLIGDTIMFTGVRPYRFIITGRTQQFINVFGEEVMVANADRALADTCSELDACASEYTVAPIFLEADGKGGHEWVVEFEKAPADLSAFAARLDQNLQNINSDYEAKRFNNMALERLRLHAAPVGTFQEWLRRKGKLGGQHKVPRLSNKRKVLEEVLGIVDTMML